MSDRLAMASHLANQAMRAGGYYGLYEFMNRVLRRIDKTDTPPYKPKGPVPSMAELRRDWLEVLLADARNVGEGLYPPMSESEFAAPLDHIDRLRAMFADLPVSTARRHAKDGVEVTRSPQAQQLPDYYTQNFHYQTGGYLTDHSARIYDVQVETLFLGAAQAMRRHALKPIAKFVRGRDQRTMRLLDVACGTGRFLGQAAQAFPGIKSAGVDLSLPYLGEARRYLKARPGIKLIQANGEALPFADQSQDVVVSIFLYHELPAPVRRKVTNEVARVLKPGGIFVFIDSLQRGDKPGYDGLLEAFPIRFHEPYYAQYTRDDLSGMFGQAGLKPRSESHAFLSKVVTRERV